MLQVDIKLVMLGTEWAKNRTFAIDRFWEDRLEFNWEFVAGLRSAVEMKEWGDALTVLDDPVVNRWRDPEFELTLLSAEYRAPKNFLGLIYDKRASVSGLYLETEKVLEVFSNEQDTVSAPDDGDTVQRRDLGGGFECWTNHELSHYFYQHVLHIPDNTHLHFYTGHPERAREEIFRNL